MATLDPRRAAMLREMGIATTWVPREADGAPDEAGPRAAAPEPAAGEETSWAQPVPGGASRPVAGAPAGRGAESLDARAAAIAAMSWDELAGTVAACTACGLCKGRSQTVFGVGDRAGPWMLVGEAPGAEEDARGEPFVGQAGRLLDNMLAALRLKRGEGVYIANVLKCRPPGNRNPEPSEVAACEPFLKRQIELVQPRIIVVLGRFAAQSLLGTEASIASLRGRLHHYEAAGRRIPVVVTYHPAYLLRNLTDKAKSWADLCLAHDAAMQAPAAASAALDLS